MNLNDIDKNIIEKFEKNAGYVFKNKNLLLSALTHSSYSHEIKINKRECYERLEFLGDAVLELVSSEYIFKNNARMDEGGMTKLRSSYVCEQTLAYCARELKLDTMLYLGKGEIKSGGSKRDSILCDVMEATIGAVFMDSDFEIAKKYINDHVLKDIDKKVLFYDCKTNLQEIVQRNGESKIEYVIIDEFGPEHNRTFKCEVIINGKSFAEGEGHSKKKAEQEAAYKALKMLIK
ncbi:MAG: ribonuclease III [Lachnospiraceae bacterium]|nr:ribonuclease III [Lachnospiraceae bacterium]